MKMWTIQQIRTALNLSRDSDRNIKLAVASIYAEGDKRVTMFKRGAGWSFLVREDLARELVADWRTDHKVGAPLGNTNHRGAKKCKSKSR